MHEKSVISLHFCTCKHSSIFDDISCVGLNEFAEIGTTLAYNNLVSIEDWRKCEL